MYKSIDGSENWENLSTGLPNRHYTLVSALVIDPLTPAKIYATLPVSGGVYMNHQGMGRILLPQIMPGW